MNSLRIGVLGGIGPEATGTFYLDLIAKLQKEKLITGNGDFPQLIINSIPAPELVFDKISDDELQPYIDGLKELDSLNPDFIVMVCNTIHLFYDKLQAAIHTDIVDMREQVFLSLSKGRKEKVTIIGTPSTVSLGLYDFGSITYLNPNQKELEILSNSIFLFNKGVDRELQIKKTMTIADKYLQKGSQVILLGCTEFGVMLKDSAIPKLNTIDVLVEAVVERVRNNS